MQNAFPVLKTERLLLREILQQDIHIIFKRFSHPGVIKHFGVSFKTLEATQEQMDWYANMITNDTGRCWLSAHWITIFFTAYAPLTSGKKNTEKQKPATGFFLGTGAWASCPKL